MRAGAATIAPTSHSAKPAAMGATRCSGQPGRPPSRRRRAMPFTTDTAERRKTYGFAYDPIFDVELARRALAEDVGRGDLTTEATIPAGTRASGRIIAKADGVVAGLPMAALVFRLMDPATH